jgi:hypothetical protein
VDVVLAVGERIYKRVRVFGERIWVPGIVASMVPSRPAPTTRVPVAWELSFGGYDPDDPRCLEPRNPCGSGVVKNPKALEGRRAPSFEDPRDPVGDWKDRPQPVGFGPIAPHWQPRVALAGTYDEAWRKNRSPLPPLDFDPAFHNVAPTDQQLDRFVAGEKVSLTYMTAAVHDSFTLPDLSVPVAFAVADALVNATTVVDTIIVEPEERRFSLVARAAVPLGRHPTGLRQVIVGELTPGQRRALEQGKAHRSFV